MDALNFIKMCHKPYLIKNEIDNTVVDEEGHNYQYYLDLCNNVYENNIFDDVIIANGSESKNLDEYLEKLSKATFNINHNVKSIDTIYPIVFIKDIDKLETINLKLFNYQVREKIKPELQKLNINYPFKSLQTINCNVDVIINEDCADNLKNINAMNITLNRYYDELDSISLRLSSNIDMKKHYLNLFDNIGYVNTVEFRDIYESSIIKAILESFEYFDNLKLKNVHIDINEKFNDYNLMISYSNDIEVLNLDNLFLKNCYWIYVVNIKNLYIENTSISIINYVKDLTVFNKCMIKQFNIVHIDNLKICGDNVNVNVDSIDNLIISKCNLKTIKINANVKNLKLINCTGKFKKRIYAKNVIVE